MKADCLSVGATTTAVFLALNSRQPRPALPSPRLRPNYGSNTALRDVAAYPRLKPLPWPQEARLIQKAQHGDDEARNIVWRHHLGFAISVANQFRIPHDLLADAVQEANLGMARAILGFDVQRHSAFSSYAWHFVFHRVHRFVFEQQFSVSIPGYLRKQYAHFCTELRRCADASAWSVWRAGWLAVNAELYEHFSLSRAVIEARSIERRDEVIDEHDGPEAQMLAAERCQAVQHALRGLPRRQRIILEQRYGLDGRKVRRRAVLARRFGLSRERIRQLEVAAEDALREILARNLDIRRRPGISVPAPKPRRRRAPRRTPSADTSAP